MIVMRLVAGYSFMIVQAFMYHRSYSACADWVYILASGPGSSRSTTTRAPFFSSFYCLHPRVCLSVSITCQSMSEQFTDHIQNSYTSAGILTIGSITTTLLILSSFSACSYAIVFAVASQLARVWTSCLSLPSCSSSRSSVWSTTRRSTWPPPRRSSSGSTWRSMWTRTNWVRVYDLYWCAAL